MRHAAAPRDLVLEVQPQHALANHMLQEVRDVAGVELAGVQRHGTRNIGCAVHPDAANVDYLPRAGYLTVATRLRGQIHDNRTPTHSVYHWGGDQQRGLPPWDRGRRDHDVSHSHTRG